MQALEALGYLGRPFEADAHEAALQTERRRSLVRLGVTGLCTMQAMTFGVALHAGGIEGIDSPFRDLLRLASLPVTGAVLVVGAQPYFLGALRDLRARAWRATHECVACWSGSSRASPSRSADVSATASWAAVTTRGVHW